MLPLHTPSWVKLKGQPIFSSESSHVAYQMNRKIGHVHSMVIYDMGGLQDLGRFSLIHYGPRILQ